MLNLGGIDPEKLYRATLRPRYFHFNLQGFSGFSACFILDCFYDMSNWKLLWLTNFGQNGTFCINKLYHGTKHRTSKIPDRLFVTGQNVEANIADLYLRANVCNFRKSVDNREFLNFFIFCPNNLYSTLISKITLKLVTAFYFFLNRAKFEKRLIGALSSMKLAKIKHFLRART